MAWRKEEWITLRGNNLPLGSGIWEGSLSNLEKEK